MAKDIGCENGIILSQIVQGNEMKQKYTQVVDRKIDKYVDTTVLSIKYKLV